MMSPLQSWPPPSLEVNAEAIVNECETAEVCNIQRPLLAPIHMAALLYLGEYVHARHLWRRTSERDALLQDWWNVAKARLEHLDATPLLQHCFEAHPEPLKTYAQQLLAQPPHAHHRSEPPYLTQQLVSFLETTKWNV